MNSDKKIFIENNEWKYVLATYIFSVITFTAFLNQYLKGTSVLLFISLMFFTSVSLKTHFRKLSINVILIFSLFSIAALGFLKIKWFTFGLLGIAITATTYRPREFLNFILDKYILLTGFCASIFSLSLYDRMFFNFSRIPWAEKDHAILANGAVDTFFHSAVANMSMNFSNISTGIDGINPLFYHAFSHVLYAGFSSILNVSNFIFYNLYAGVLIVPILWTMLLGLFFSISRKLQAEIKATHLPLFFVFLYLFTYLNFLPYKDFPEAPSLNHIQLISDSFTVSLLLLIALLSFLNDQEKPLQFKNVLLTSLLCVIMSFTKISTASFAIAVCGLFYTYKLLTNFNVKKIFPFLFFASISLGGFFYFTLRAEAQSQQIDFFNFYKLFPRSWILWSFEFLYNYVHFFIICFIGCKIIREKKIKDTGVILICIAMAFLINELPGLLFAFPSGAAGYFSAVFKRIAFPYLFFFLLQSNYLSRFRIPVYAQIGSLMIFFATQANLSPKQKIQFDPTSGDKKIYDLFLNLRAEQNAVIYMSKKNPVWKTPPFCYKVPFIGPSITGQIFINNLHPDCVYKNYGFESLKTIPLTATTETNSALCQYIRDRKEINGKNLLVIDKNSDLQRVDCSLY